MPHMTDEDQPRFNEGFAAMVAYFRDPVPLTQQVQYWRLLHERITLAEWDYAVEQAMLRETFTNVPLVAHLMDYVREYRKAHDGRPKHLRGLVL